MIETQLKFERARAALEQRDPKDLAAFILSLAYVSDGVGGYVQAFATADNPEMAAKIITHEINSLRAGERDYDVRHRRSFVISARAERALDSIVTVLTPKDAAAAREALQLFIASEQQILDSCHEDDAAGEIFVRAREIAAQWEGVSPSVSSTTYAD